MSTSFRVTLFFFFLLILFCCQHAEASSTHANGSFINETTVMMENEIMVPLMEKGSKMVMMMNESYGRRKLGSFQICALCTCCGGARGLCLPSPCCYAINCNIPNRPFGFCSFTPKTCNCFRCHL